MCGGLPDEVPEEDPRLVLKCHSLINCACNQTAFWIDLLHREAIHPRHRANFRAFFDPLAFLAELCTHIGSVPDPAAAREMNCYRTPTLSKELDFVGVVCQFPLGTACQGGGGVPSLGGQVPAPV